MSNFVEYHVDAPLDVIKNSLDALKEFDAIGIIATIQHVHQLNDIKAFYEKNGKTVLIGKPYGPAKNEGQVLGCDAGSAASINEKVDAFVYFGGGIFHPLGALIATTKPFFVADPFLDKKFDRIDAQREVYAKEKKAGSLARSTRRDLQLCLALRQGSLTWTWQKH